MLVYVLHAFVNWEAILSKAPTMDFSKYQFGNTCIPHAVLTFLRSYSQQIAKLANQHNVLAILTVHIAHSFMCSAK